MAFVLKKKKKLLFHELLFHAVVNSYFAAMHESNCIYERQYCYVLCL